MATIQVRIDGQYHRLTTKTKGAGVYVIDYRDPRFNPPRRVRRTVGPNLTVAKRERSEIEVRMDKIRHGHIDPNEEQFKPVALDEFEDTVLPVLLKSDVPPIDESRRCVRIFAF